MCYGESASSRSTYNHLDSRNSAAGGPRRIAHGSQRCAAKRIIVTEVAGVHQIRDAASDSIDPEAVADFIDRRVMTVESIDAQGYTRSRFTRREMDVMAAIVTGCSNKEIGVKLSISKQTVKHHLSSISIRPAYRAGWNWRCTYGTTSSSAGSRRAVLIRAWFPQHEA